MKVVAYSHTFEEREMTACDVRLECGCEMPCPYGISRSGLIYVIQLEEMPCPLHEPQRFLQPQGSDTLNQNRG